MGRPLTPYEVRSGRLVWLLDLTWAGRVWRFASEPVDVETDDGEVVRYQDGLSVSGIRRGVELFDDTPDTPAVTVRGLYFDRSVAGLIAEGHWPETATAVLSQWHDGRTLEQARVWTAGRVVEFSYGDVGEPVQLSVEPYGIEDRAVIPDAAAVVSETTWPNADDPSLGRLYPIVIGKPGFAAANASGLNGGSPGLVVDTTADTILIADGAVAATSVILVDGTTETTEAVTTTTDGRGRTVSTITHPTGVTAGASYSIRWDQSNGGVVGDDGVAVNGAGDVLVWLLSRSTVPYDVGAWAAAAAELNAYALDFYLDTDQGPWDVARGAVIPLLPISVASGADGVRPVVWRVGFRDHDAAKQITEGLDVERVSEVQHLRPPIANEHRIRYAQDTEGTYTRTCTVAGDADGADGEIVPTMHSVASLRTFGRLVAEPIETRAIQDRATAGAVVAWRAAAYAFPWRVVRYRDVAGALGGLEPGAVVRVDDADIGLSSALGWIRDITWDEAVPTADIVLLHDPARDRA